MDLSPETTDLKQGFEGTILGLPLADVLQLKHQNHFSGCVTVTNDNQQGRLFFHNGNLIHAALPDSVGEKACYRILSWSSGQFKVEPKVHAARHTIDKPLNYLILEACRLMDEQQEPALEEAPAQKSQSTSSTDYISSMLDVFYALPEVYGAMVTNRKGQMQVSKNYQEKKSGGIAGSFLVNLLSDGEYLSLVGRQIGHLLDLGDPQQTSFISNEQLVISIRDQDLALHVAFHPGQTLETARVIIRSALKSLKKD